MMPEREVLGLGGIELLRVGEAPPRRLGQEGWVVQFNMNPSFSSISSTCVLQFMA